jgi:hypothetical protein
MYVRGQEEAPETMGLLAALPSDVLSGLFQALVSHVASLDE